MDSTRRNYFLQNMWPPYPTLPAGAVAWGRLQEITRISSSEFQIIFHSKFQTDSFGRKHSVSLHFSENKDLCEILIENDLIALTEDGRLVLLSPHLCTNLTTSADFVTLKNWSLFLQGVRNFFVSQNFLEVNTPSLVACPGTEPTLDIFETYLRTGSQNKKLYLPTSPELHLKKMLHLGFEKIFEITRCYRNDEQSEIHQPEFWMIEWYRSYEPLKHIQNDVEKLVVFLVDFFHQKHIFLQKPVKIKSYTISDLFLKHYGFRLQIETTLAELEKLASDHQIQIPPNPSLDDLFFLLFFEIEKTFPKDELIFVCGYPPYQAALARTNSDGWAERFEAYWQGLELCNAFHELNDPEIQRQRSQMDLDKKTQSGKTAVSLDADFFQALQAGTPPASGVALGLERLFMALFQIQNIKKMKVFPY